VSPLLALPAGLLALLAFARLAQPRPGLRPLVFPVGATLLVGSLLVALGGRPSPAGLLALALAVLVLLVRGVVALFEVAFERSQGTAPPELLASVVSVLLYGFGIGFVAHRFFGFELTPFLATSAVVGAVVGLALQETLGNLIAGIALHTEAPFQVGDWIRSGASEGRVQQVSWRATRLRTLEGDTLTIPNSEVARHAILNFSLPESPHARVVLVEAGVQVPPNRVVSVLLVLLGQVEGVLTSPEPKIRVAGYADGSARYEIRYFLKSYEAHLGVEGEILRLVWYHFHRHGIPISPPSRELFVHTLAASPEGEGKGSRLEATLRGIELFRPLDDGALRMAASRFRRLHYGAGERIIEEGSPGDSFFIVDRGEVEVFRGAGPQKRPVARLAEGQFFGEMALLTGQKRSAQVVAVTDVDLFTIDKDGFHDVLAAHPSVAEDISALLSERREGLARTEDMELPEDAGTPVEAQSRLLGRIRAYFGL
jgi:small-conductance mechanosensitive channel/CRP-like cAMP-binding protein